MTFDPSLAFVNCPACACGEQHVQHVKYNRWACNACGHEFTGPASSVTGTGREQPRTPGRRTREAVGAMLCLLLAVTSYAQTDPRTLPMLTSAQITKLGTFDLPSSFQWGGHALAVDGPRLLVETGTSVGVVTIPAFGGVATVVQPPRDQGVSRVRPDTQNGWAVGGLYVYGGRVLMTGYSYYDSIRTEHGTHFAGQLGAMAGPSMVGSTIPGMVSGYLGEIPAEWRGLFGGPMLTGNCCIPIISRSSFGPAVSVFDPAGVTGTAPTPAVQLLGYPEAHPTLGPWSGASPFFTGADTLATVAFPSGTRSVLFVGRHGAGPFCYGTAPPCNDPVWSGQGNHAYPYQSSVWVYDANDLLAVKAGTKSPWDVQPAALWPLPGMPTTGTAKHLGATYDPATRRLYVATVDETTIHVFQIGDAVSPPAPAPCAGTWGAWTRQANSESACSASGTRTFIESRLFTVSTSGPGCPASPESRTSTDACNPPVVMETLTCWVTSVGTTYADGDARRTVRCDTNGPTASLPNGTTFTVTVPKK